MTTNLITCCDSKAGGLQSTWKHRPPSWILYLQGPHPRHRFQSPELTRNDNNRSQPPLDARNTRASHSHTTQPTPRPETKPPPTAPSLSTSKRGCLQKNSRIPYLLHWSKHTGGQDSGSLRMLGEQLHQQGSLRSLHAQKPLAACSPIRLTCAHFQRNGTYSRILQVEFAMLYAVALI